MSCESETRDLVLGHLVRDVVVFFPISYYYVQPWGYAAKDAPLVAPGS